MTDELVKRHGEQLRMTGGDLADLCQPIADAIEALTAERDSLLAGHRILNIDGARLEDRAKAAEAERDRLRCGIEYVLDGYGLDGPDYRFPYGEEDADWITDHLIAVMKGETP